MNPVRNSAVLPCPARRARWGLLPLALSGLLFACHFDPTGLRPPGSSDGGVPETCGNGRLDPGEQCEGADLGGETCTSRGYLEGALSCDASCQLDESDCSACGDGVKDPGEECDGGDYGGLTCADVTGDTHGVLACSFDCEINTDLCYSCGDGVVEQDEQCEAGDLQGRTCVSLGYTGGDLSCRDDCTYNEDGCTTCGDGACDLAQGEDATSCYVDCGIWIALTAGARHTCAVKADGSVWCWGDNNEHQLGVESPYRSEVPLRVPSPTDAATVGAGHQHGCAVTRAGLLWCWGDNAFGQLGLGVTDNYRAPTLVTGLPTTGPLVVGGYGHTCARSNSGSPFCWGLNSVGQVGDDSTTNRTTPTSLVGLSQVTDLAAGYEHVCAVDGNHGLWCWGGNGNGQLGDDSYTYHHTPNAVPGVTDAQRVFAGFRHTCAIRTGDALWCWGANGSGQLGLGDYGTHLTPTEVTGLTPPVLQMAAGRDFTCALLGTGKVHCAGLNSLGQLGDDSYTSRNTFAAVQQLDSVTRIAAGEDHACALRTDGSIWCWGHNGSGQLGDNSVSGRLLPVQVQDPY